jgi:hypothetical protein
MHRECVQPMLGIVQGTASAQIELPTVPRAGEYRRREIKVHAARRSGGQTATQNTGTYRAALMRAEIVDGVHSAVPTDDTDLSAVHTDGADRSIREFSERADVDAHATAMLAAAGRSASVQP